MTRGVVIQLPQLPEGTRVRRRRGRPRVVTPVVAQDDYDLMVDQARRDHVAADPMVTLGDAPPGEVLNVTIEQVARETAALRFEAEAAEAKGKDATMTRARRIRGLLALGDLVLEREVHRRERGELQPEVIAKIQEMFLDEIRDVAVEVMGEDAGRGFAARVEAGLDTKTDPRSVPASQ